MGILPTAPDHECFIRAWNSKKDIRKREKDLIDNIADIVPDDDPEEDPDDDPWTIQQDIDNAFNPMSTPDGKRSRPEEEGSPQQHKKHRFGHYPASRYSTDQQFLFYR